MTPPDYTFLNTVQIYQVQVALKQRYHLPVLPDTNDTSRHTFLDIRADRFVECVLRLLRKCFSRQKQLKSFHCKLYNSNLWIISLCLLLAACLPYTNAVAVKRVISSVAEETHSSVDTTGGVQHDSASLESSEVEFDEENSEYGPPSASDMVAVYILLGCLTLSGIVIIGILIYCTNQWWTKYCCPTWFSKYTNRLQTVDGGQNQMKPSANGTAGPDNRYLYDATKEDLNDNHNAQYSGAVEDDHSPAEKSLLLATNYGLNDVKIVGEKNDFRANGFEYGSPLHYEVGYDKSHMSCFRGTLTFALRYDYIHRVLMLHLIRASHLPPKDRSGTSDPYVKMYLLPDRRNHCKTRIHRKTLSAEFNEMFSFRVAYNTLSSRMLQFTVYDFDRFSRHDLIGNVIMRDIFEKSDLYTWTEYTMHIIASNDKADYGDLLVYLIYIPAEEKLTVTIVKAFNLRPMDITGASDPYVKIYHLVNKRRIKMKRTTTKRANLNPVYQEVISFDNVNPRSVEDVQQTNVVLKVMDWDRIGHDDLLGCTVLGPDSPTQEGKAQWQEAVMSPGKAVGRWHSLLADVPAQFTNLSKSGK